MSQGGDQINNLLNDFSEGTDQSCASFAARCTNNKPVVANIKNIKLSTEETKITSELTEETKDNIITITQENSTNFCQF